MYYRLAADKCGDPAYPRISLSTLVELLSLFGSGSLKTIIQAPKVNATPQKAAVKEQKLNKKQTLPNNKAEIISAEHEDLSHTTLTSTELKTGFFSLFGND